MLYLVYLVLFLVGLLAFRGLLFLFLLPSNRVSAAERERQEMLTRIKNSGVEMVLEVYLQERHRMTPETRAGYEEVIRKFLSEEELNAL